MNKISSDGKRNVRIREDTLQRFMSQYGIGIVLFAMIIIIGILKPNFLSGNNVLNILAQISINCIIAFGMCLAITTGGIDLAVGSQIALSSCILGQMIVNFNMSMWVAIPVALAATTVMGLINGFLISKFKMFAFVVTLSTQLIIRSLAQIISNGQSQSMSSVAFKSIYSGKLFDIIPYPIVYMLLIVFIMYIVMHWTKFGRYIFAVGGNENAAIASGVNVVKIRLICYTLSGLLAGIAGIIFTAKTAASQANIGVGYETDAVAACVLGGTSFAGGIATAPGILIGSIIIGCISNGMNFLGIGSYYQSMTKGIIILLAVLLDMIINKKNR